MLINKNKSTLENIALAASEMKCCTKLPMANIVMPSLDEQGLMAYVFPGMVITKEQPTGCRYGSAASPVLRVLGGKLLKNGMADAYAWDVATYQKKAAKTHPVGFGFGATVESVKWAMEILNTVQDPTERDMLTKFLLEQHGLRLIFSPKEQRQCIEVTQELYNSGLTVCADEWMKPDENGMVEATILNVGDFLIVTHDGIYCIRREEFLETHTL